MAEYIRNRMASKPLASYNVVAYSLALSTNHMHAWSGFKERRSKLCTADWQ